MRFLLNLLTAMGAVLQLATHAAAGTCTMAVKGYLCGGLINHSGYTAKWTDNPNSSSGTGYCKFWNWGTSNPTATVKCTQKDLLPGSQIGGGGSSKTTDVDAFTFATVDYVLDVAGVQHLITKGVWTKISDVQMPTCTQSGSRPYCRY